MLYGSQKRFDKNGDGKLKGAEWQRWYQYAYGDEIEAKEKRSRANAAAEQKRAQIAADFADHVSDLINWIYRDLAHLEGEREDQAIRTMHLALYVISAALQTQKVDESMRYLLRAFWNEFQPTLDESVYQALCAKQVLFAEIGEISEKRLGSFWRNLLDNLPPERRVGKDDDLQELLDENCDLEMVSAADKDCHRRRFKTKLIAMGMRGLDRVIVEPSGIYEADEFFDVLREEPLDNWYEIGSVITIADACLDTNLSEASDYLLASQLSEAGIVLMSRCQEATKQELEDTLKHLEAVQKKFHCHRMTKPEIIMKDWSELTDEDMGRIANSGYEPDSHEKLWFDQDKAYTSLYFMNMKLPDNAMEDAVSRLMSDSKCGRIFRVKGFMENAEGKWLELNATHKNITVKPIERGQAVFIVIGEGLDKEHIDGYFVPV